MKIFILVFASLLALATLPAPAAQEPSETASPASSAPASGSSYLDRARELAIQALSMIGINYKYGGAAPDDGFDCSGLVSHVFNEVAGIVLPRNSQGMSKVGDNVGKSELQPGDLVFFNTRRRPFSHVGIYIGDERFVHAPSRGGEVEVTNMRSGYWKNRYNGARRVNF